MANYTYVQNIRPRLTVESLEMHLKSAVLDLHGPRWVVQRADFEDEGPTFLVTLPGTAEVNRERLIGRLTTAEDIGWICSLAKKGASIAFRHGPLSQFAEWVQGSVAEELSERLNASLYFDAGPTTYKPGRREYRRGKTVREYLLRNFNGVPEDAAHEDFVRRLLVGTPKEFL